MPDPNKFLSTREFAKQAGVSASTISKWLRSHKIIGHKQGRKWMIPADEIAKILQSKPSKSAKQAPAEPQQFHPSAKAKNSAKSYSIKEFSAMTYLTEYGVQKWLKEGRLIGTADESGHPRVAAQNLESTDVQRLLRK